MAENGAFSRAKAPFSPCPEPTALDRNPAVCQTLRLWSPAASSRLGPRESAVVAPLTVLSPVPGLAGTPSTGNGNECLKRLSRFRGSGVCRQPVTPGMPVIGAQVAAG